MIGIVQLLGLTAASGSHIIDLLGSKAPPRKAAQAQVPGRQDLVQILGQPCQGEEQGQAEQPAFALVLPPLR